MRTRKTDAVRDWTRTQVGEYAKLYPLYCQYAATLRTVLEHVAAQFIQYPIIQSRPKSIASFTEKILRKREKYHDPVHQLTDLCGGRIIAESMDQVDGVCAYIEAHFLIDTHNSQKTNQRLRPNEFGYRSNHYVLQFRPGEFPNADVPVHIPQELYGLKAEVQVRTILEHAWANFAHDRIYKTGAQLPIEVQRQMNSVAAMLEEADMELVRVLERLKVYAASFGAYMDGNQLRDEIGLLQIVLEHDRGNAQAAEKVALYAATLGNWDLVIRTLEPFGDHMTRSMRRTLGLALCRKYENEEGSDHLLRGQQLLKQAGTERSGDADALVYLANTLKTTDPDLAREYLHRAVEIDPGNSYALGHYLETEIVKWNSPQALQALAPVIQQAIGRDRQQAAAGINLPWAYFNIGRFHLFTGRVHDGLAAFARAISLSPVGWMLETTLASLHRLDGVGDRMEGLQAAQTLLKTGMIFRFGDKSNLAPGCCPPVVYLPFLGDLPEPPAAELNLLRSALAGFSGQLYLLGPAGTVEAWIKELRAPDSKFTVCAYLLTQDHDLANQDVRVVDCSMDGGVNASVRLWADLAESGMHASDICVPGILGGNLAGLNYRLALGLGARVGLLPTPNSVEEQLFTDPDWYTLETLGALPADQQVLRAFFSQNPAGLEEEARLRLAQYLHEEYRTTRLQALQNKDRSVTTWERLSDELRESSGKKADHIQAQLEQIGCSICPVEIGSVRVISFSDDEILALARLEHARWVVERSLNGWRYGAEKDTDRKINPNLVAWEQLSPTVQEWNLKEMRNLPTLLAGLGLEIQRIVDQHGSGA